MMDKTSRIMTVLPPKEGFSADCVGAVGLLVRRLAQPDDLIVGRALTSLPFSGLRYLEISKNWFSIFIKNKAYRYGVASVVRKYRPCLIEIHNRPEIALFIAQRFPKIPVTLTLHNDPLSMRGLKTSIERKRILRKVHVVAVSQWVKERFLSRQVVGNVTILPNNIDLQEIPEYVPIPEREKKILFVGRVVADKGADLFVQICEQFLQIDPTWTVEIIGADRFDMNSPETPFIQQLKHQIKSKQIHMTGYLPYDQVLQKMAHASVVIMPSRWSEPFGMTALEAMACGTPLLASFVGALPQIVGQGGLLIDPKKPEHAVLLLSKLLKNMQLRQELSVKAIQQASVYNKQDAFQRLVAFRKRICSALTVEHY
ncbi:glycosyltransferase family 4 protein [Commensalibacter communis]|uniref:glycosyltransferase family 4 protein n=1 Tax=Commensalibacter communis TaxID=2972786 RepID=UPI0022FFBEF3|nr:glycosyltransferase family 4 protein [Commensalibacter communis]CAI3950379.1 Glycosyltransferase involved in cell wall bisynthesis (RfaB) (PDB:2IV7) [Commensalibacter communis]CAI3956119.1 Glycosyltransferase involved in cell wall bisynthesis (RfaB) (PDB:2IV7) [Commensalibacter communis]